MIELQALRTLNKSRGNYLRGGGRIFVGCGILEKGINTLIKFKKVTRLVGN